MRELGGEKPEHPPLEEDEAKQEVKRGMTVSVTNPRFQFLFNNLVLNKIAIELDEII